MISNDFEKRHFENELFVEGCQSEFLNQAVCQKIIEVIEDMPEGDRLLKDALLNGPITIKVVKNPTDEDDVWIHAGAAWDSSNRIILILFRDDPNELIKPTQFKWFSLDCHRLFDFFSNVVFELCNAANPLLQETKSPLLFPNRDLFARDIEFKEFKTYQRLANFRNYLSYKYLGFLGTEEQYNDDQFENYMKLADSENGYGEAKSHAGSYRKMWDDDLIKCQKLIEMAKQSQINMIQLKTFMDNNVCREVQETYFFLKSKSQ